MRQLDINTNICLCPDLGYFDDGTVQCKCKRTFIKYFSSVQLKLFQVLNELT